MVIDMQNDFATDGYPLYCEMGGKMVPKLVDFIDKCRSEGMQIIYTRTAYRADEKDMGDAAEVCEPIRKNHALVDGFSGSELIEQLEILPEDIVLDKYKYSAFYGTHLDIIIKSMGLENMIVTGLCTEACCFSTARDAQQRDMQVAFIADLTGNMDFPDLGWGSMNADEMHRAMLINIALTTAHVMNSDDVFGLL